MPDTSNRRSVYRRDSSRRRATISGSRFQLLAPDGGLDVGHPVVEAKNRIGFGHDPIRRMPNRIGHAHPMVPPQPESLVPVCSAGCDHATVPGCQELSGVKRKTGRVSVWTPDPLPAVTPPDFAARRARRILDEGQRVTFRNCGQGTKITRHAELVYAQNRPGTWTERRLDPARDRCCRWRSRHPRRPG